MAHKENADVLAEKLRQKSFPVFIGDRGGDGLYRVDVGPYPDAEYAHSVKDELMGGGFRTVLERQLHH
jgi:cell division septation protein DedD